MRQMLDFTYANLANTDFSQTKYVQPKDQMMDGFIFANMVHMYFSGCQFEDDMFRNDIGFANLPSDKSV